jgi:hypothetical protein
LECLVLATPLEIFDSMRQSFQANNGESKDLRSNVTFVARDKNWVAVLNGKLRGTWA